VVDALALPRERAEPVTLGEVAVDVRPAGARVPGRDQRQALTDGRLLVQQPEQLHFVGLEQRRGWVVPRRLRARNAVVEVEVALKAGRPVEAPSHPLPV